LQLLVSDPQSVAGCCLLAAASLSCPAPEDVLGLPKLRPGFAEAQPLHRRLAVVLKAADLCSLSAASGVVAQPLGAVSRSLGACSIIHTPSAAAVVYSSGRLGGSSVVCASLGVIMHGLRRWLGGAEAHTRVCVSPIVGCERLGPRCLGQK
jgi:hypothetical protein